MTDAASWLAPMTEAPNRTNARDRPDRRAAELARWRANAWAVATQAAGEAAVATANVEEVEAVKRVAAAVVAIGVAGAVGVGTGSAVSPELARGSQDSAAAARWERRRHA